MDNQYLSKAITALLNGKVIVYPTDTLYGLGADIFNEDAVKKVFEIKKRPLDDPLPIAVSDSKMLKKVAELEGRSQKLIDTFLPGKLTLILRKKEVVPDIVTGGLKKIAVRIPDNNFALDILSRFGPITATSANIHGNKTPELIEDISNQFSPEDIALYIDVGKLDGLPSTIVDVSNQEIIVVREGAIKKEDILEAISYE